ncbi:hypothetical protein ABPG72_012859 [Tetrahymena utriculariae]
MEVESQVFNNLALELTENLQKYQVIVRHFDGVFYQNQRRNWNNQRLCFKTHNQIQRKWRCAQELTPLNKDNQLQVNSILNLKDFELYEQQSHLKEYYQQNKQELGTFKFPISYPLLSLANKQKRLLLPKI